MIVTRFFPSRPDFHVSVTIKRDPEIERLVSELSDDGYRLESEELSTGAILLIVTDEHEAWVGLDLVLKTEIDAGGTDLLLERLDAMIRKTHAATGGDA